jgi:hypothetical protein
LETFFKPPPILAVDFYPENMLQEGGHPYLFRMGVALREMFSQSTRGFRDNGGKYLHFNLSPAQFNTLAKDCNYLPKFYRKNGWWLKKCLQDDVLREEYFLKTHWMILLIGTRGASMFNHSDSLMTSSWQAQVRGRKYWYICGRSTSRGAPKHTHCYEDIVRSGEMVFYPKRWTHRTINLDTPTVALTGTISDKNNHNSIAQELYEECTYSKHSFDISGKLCDALDKCGEVWHDRFLTGQKRRSWRDNAIPDEIRKRDAVHPSKNNYNTQPINE